MLGEDHVGRAGKDLELVVCVGRRDDEHHVGLLVEVLLPGRVDAAFDDRLAGGQCSFCITFVPLSWETRAHLDTNWETLFMKQESVKGKLE